MATVRLPVAVGREKPTGNDGGKVALVAKWKLQAKGNGAVLSVHTVYNEIVRSGWMDGSIDPGRPT